MFDLSRENKVAPSSNVGCIILKLNLSRMCLVGVKFCLHAGQTLRVCQSLGKQIRWQFLAELDPTAAADRLLLLAKFGLIKICVRLSAR